MSGVRPVKAYAVIKNNRILVNEIYDSKDVVLAKGEKLVRVTISCEK
jgi:hypothetical protein